MIIGQRRAIAFEETVKVPYIDQYLNLLVLDKTVREEISSGHDLFQLGNAGVNSRGYCSAFTFSGGEQQKRAGRLLLGKRNRVRLAKRFHQLF